MGEITLRDSLIVAAAAAGAQAKQAWLLQREVLPLNWTDSAVDLMIYRTGHQGALHSVGGVELKWWRHNDRSNAANRRRDLVKDFVRAVALYREVEAFAFVALLSTEVSWSATTNTVAADASAMGLVTSDDSMTWNLKALHASPAVRGAVRALAQRVPIPNIFHSKLLSTLELRVASGRSAFSRGWSLKKPQRMHFLDEAEIQQMLQHET